MPDYIKVEGQPNLVRDKKSKAILNVNVEALAVYRKEREKRMRINKMVDEFEDMKSDLGEIKNLLKILIDK